MPAILDDHIPIANYGSSNLAKLKQTYRRGLHHRYGSPMQTISGLHYNFSLSRDFWDIYLDSEFAAKHQLNSVSAAYFHLMRNFRRHSWLLVYCFGASPAFDQSFMQNHPYFQGQDWKAYEPLIKPLGKRSFYCPDATSLRMSALGYRSAGQSAIKVCFNGLPDYIASMRKALLMDCPQHQAIGLKDQQGYKQLNTHLLQIENEFYSSIRPKQITQEHERPLHALTERGVAYLEIRLLDNNCFVPSGIDERAIDFIALFLLSCLFDDSPFIEDKECNAIEAFQEKIILEGRNKEIKLKG